MLSLEGCETLVMRRDKTSLLSASLQERTLIDFTNWPPNWRRARWMPLLLLVRRLPALPNKRPVSFPLLLSPWLILSMTSWLPVLLGQAGTLQARRFLGRS